MTLPGLASRVPGPGAERLAQAPVATDPNQVVRRTCATCHNDQSLRGNLSLEHFDVTAAFDDTADSGDAEVAERMVRKLRADMMPPPGTRRPDPEALLTLVETLERNLDAGAATPPPTPAVGPSSVSTARSMPAPSTTCWRSTSTPPTGCRSTR